MHGHVRIEIGRADFAVHQFLHGLSADRPRGESAPAVTSGRSSRRENRTRQFLSDVRSVEPFGRLSLQWGQPLPSTLSVVFHDALKAGFSLTHDVKARRLTNAATVLDRYAEVHAIAASDGRVRRRGVNQLRAIVGRNPDRLSVPAGRRHIHKIRNGRTRTDAREALQIAEGRVRRHHSAAHRKVGDLQHRRAPHGQTPAT